VVHRVCLLVQTLVFILHQLVRSLMSRLRRHGSVVTGHIIAVVQSTVTAVSWRWSRRCFGNILGANIIQLTGHTLARASNC